MGSFWRYVTIKDDPTATDQSGRSGWTIPWSADDLARRHWYLAVQADVTPLQLTPADWRWLREQESPLWRQLSTQGDNMPAVTFIYDALWRGPGGESSRRRCQNYDLIMSLKRWAVAHGWDRPERGRRFWAAVWRDLKVAPAVDRLTLRSVRRLTGQPCVISLSDNEELASWSRLPKIWRQTVAQTSLERAEGLMVRGALVHWSDVSLWPDLEREVIISKRSLTRWVDGWLQLSVLLAETPLSSANTTRHAAGQVLREFYWHELVRGVATAELLLHSLSSEDRRPLEKILRRIPAAPPQQAIGSVQFDLRLLGGLFHRLPPRWHRRRWGGPWRRLGQKTVSPEQAAKLVDAWGQALLDGDWSGWTVVVDEAAQSWLVQTHQRRVVIPSQPTNIALSTLLPIAAHELTHAWQTIQADRESPRSLAIWHSQTGATEALAEAGAMVTERAVRRHLGGPDLTRRFYRRGLSARRRGQTFPQVMAAVLRGMVEETGLSLKRIPLTQRGEMARQAFRKALRLYRPDLSLRPSRRLLNDEQLKYVASDLLADELTRANLTNLMSINSIDLVRWPLYRRLGFDAVKIASFPQERLIEIMDAALAHLIA